MSREDALRGRYEIHSLDRVSRRYANDTLNPLDSKRFNGLAGFATNAVFDLVKRELCRNGCEGDSERANFRGILQGSGSTSPAMNTVFAVESFLEIYHEMLTLPPTGEITSGSRGQTIWLSTPFAILNGLAAVIID